MAKQIVNVPDIGGAENVDVIEISVSPGDVVAVDDPLITLESDKASMEIPSMVAGKVISLLIKEGDQVSEGAAILELETESSSSADSLAANAVDEKSDKPKPPTQGAELPVAVPDIGGAEAVDVIEICVAVGDAVSEGDSIIVLESDKASMEVPSPADGTVVSISIAEGNKVSEGDALLVLSVTGPTAADAADKDSTQKVESANEPVAASVPSSETVLVPDIGGSEDVDVIEVNVDVGDSIEEGDSIIVLESDKASMEVPAPMAGKVTSVLIKEGDKASEGTPVLVLEVVGKAVSPTAPAAPAPKKEEPPQPKRPSKPQTTSELYPQEIHSAGSSVYAGPAVRKLARQLGVDLSKVNASGPKGRITKDDVKAFVKRMMTSKPTAAATAGAGIPPIPEVDFAQFGEVELVKMSKIHRLTATNMSRNWLNVPHVTQFDDADITELEAFRKGMKVEAEKAGVKLTPLPFLLKACAAALKYEPSFNVSLHSDGEQLVKKKYVHIGVAVATPAGLMVPVIKDVDKKGLYELADESNMLAKKARDGKLMPRDMQGGCFTISSLGAIGGTGFTPIVNAPEVAILGVSKADIKPVWDGNSFVPRQMLPLCLSYDHRAINGADAGRFFTYLAAVLGDIRKLIL